MNAQLNGGRGSRPIRALIVDDHRAFSEALATAVNVQEDIECVGVATTVAEALALAAERSPDVVLMDVRLPDADGIEGTLRLKAMRPEARVLVLTAHTDLTVMARAASAGAAGFLPKESPVAEILQAIRTANGGGMLVESSSLAMVLQRLGTEREAALRGSRYSVTPRELHVLALMGEGLDPRAIARRLGLSIHTVRGHVKSILQKLGVHSQLEAVVLAFREGLLRGEASTSAVAVAGAGREVSRTRVLGDG